MKSGIRLTRLWTFFATLAIILSFSGPALAVDDGARAYWKGRDGTNVVSFQYLNLNMQASGTQQFDPAHFIYPNAIERRRLPLTSSGVVSISMSTPILYRQVFYPRGCRRGTRCTSPPQDSLTPACSLMLTFLAPHRLRVPSIW